MIWYLTNGELGKKMKLVDVDSVPIVKAIPIEWIEELAAKLIEEDNFEKAMFLLDIRDIWEKENEQV